MYKNDSKEVIILQKFILDYINSSIKQKLNNSLTNVNVPVQYKLNDNIKYNKNNKYNTCLNYNVMYDSDLLNALYEN